jgi:hypothetical protein
VFVFLVSCGTNRSDCPDRDNVDGRAVDRARNNSAWESSLLQVLETSLGTRIFRVSNKKAGNSACKELKQSGYQIQEQQTG